MPFHFFIPQNWWNLPHCYFFNWIKYNLIKCNCTSFFNILCFFTYVIFVVKTISVLLFVRIIFELYFCTDYSCFSFFVLIIVLLFFFVWTIHWLCFRSDYVYVNFRSDQHALFFSFRPFMCYFFVQIIFVLFFSFKLSMCYLFRSDYHCVIFFVRVISCYLFFMILLKKMGQYIDSSINKITQW